MTELKRDLVPRSVQQWIDYFGFELIEQVVIVSPDNGMETGWVRVTPEAAYKVIEHRNTINRRLSEESSELYGQSMINDEMQETHQGCCMDIHGIFSDGQHRFNGCIIAEKPFVTMMTFNAPPGTRLVVDRGRPKEEHDIYKMYGIEATPALVATFNAVLNHGVPKSKSQAKLTEMERASVYKLIHKDIITVHDLCRDIEREHIKRGIQKGALVALQAPLRAPMVRALVNGSATLESLREFLTVLQSQRSLKPYHVLVQSLAKTLLSSQWDNIHSDTTSKIRKSRYALMSFVLDRFLRKEVLHSFPSLNEISKIKELFPLDIDQHSEVRRIAQTLGNQFVDRISVFNKYKYIQPVDIPSEYDEIRFPINDELTQPLNPPGASFLPGKITKTDKCESPFDASHVWPADDGRSVVVQVPYVDGRTFVTKYPIDKYDEAVRTVDYCLLAFSGDQAMRINKPEEYHQRLQEINDTHRSKGIFAS